MTVVQSETFVLTDAEAAAVQSANMARQASIARANPAHIAFSIAVPILLLVVVYGVDLIWYGGAMPPSLFSALLVAFVGGMFTQMLSFKLTLEMSKRRMRQATRQVFAPRTVRLTDEGIEHALPEVRSLFAWTGNARAQVAPGLILIWAGHVLAAAVPVRALACRPDAQAFLEACRQHARAAG
jgi:hypothetical protein